MKPIRLQLPFKQSSKLLLPVVAASMFILGFESGGFQLALLKVGHEFQVNSTMMGGMVAAQYSAIVVMPLLFGAFSDRVGKKIVTLISCAVFVLGSFVTAAAPSPWVFMAGIFVLGTGYSVTEGTTAAALADAYQEKSAKYLSITQCCFSMGAVAGPLLADLAMTRLGASWRIVFILSGAVYLLLWPVFLHTVFRTADASKREQGAKGALRMLLTGVFVCLVLSIVLYVGLENGVGYFLDSLFTKALDAPHLSAAAISAFWFAMMVARFVSSLLRRHPKELLVACFGGSVIILLVLVATNSLPVALAGCALLGFLSGPIWPMLVSLAAQEFPAHSGLATSIMVAGCGVGGAVTPIFMGTITDTFGVKNAFVLLTILAVAAVAVSLLYLRKSKKKSNA